MTRLSHCLEFIFTLIIYIQIIKYYHFILVYSINTQQILTHKQQYHICINSILGYLHKQTNTNQDIHKQYLIIRQMDNQPATKRQLLSIHESSLLCNENLYSSSNTNGFVSFGYASNNRASQKCLQYLPKYLKLKDCAYEEFKGSNYFRNYFSQQLNFNKEQCLVLSSIESVISVFAFKQKVSYEGLKINPYPIFQHSEAQVTDQSHSTRHFIQVINEDHMQTILSKQHSVDTVLILDKLQWIKNQQNKQNQKIIYALNCNFNQGFKFGVCFCKNNKLLEQLMPVYCFQPLSTLIAPTFQAIHCSQQNKKMQAQFMDEHRHKQIDYSPFYEMLKKDSGYLPKPEHIFLSIGSGISIYNWAFSLFRPQDKLGVDSPYYFCFRYDFQKSGIVFVFRDVYKDSLFDRIKQSQASGQKGYVVVNPHNPTGYVFEKQQILLICNWAISHPNYHILFDQVYLQSVHCDSIKTVSASKFADLHQNIHVVRGFSKDYGLCGFKVGYIISSNTTITTNFKKWRSLIQPQDYTVKTIFKLLEKSNFGQEIYEFNSKCLKQSTNLIVSQLLKNKIEFIESQGGIFLMINLTKYIQEHKQTEESIWKTLFYDYRVNISRGADFQTQKPGYFRLCYLLSEERVIQGIRRIGMFLRKQKPPFQQ